MARFKDFGSGASTNAEPVVFKLHGEEFTCIPSIQGKDLLEIVSDTASEDVATSSAVTLRFFRSVLTTESLVRFDALMDSKERVVSLDTLTDITSWLIEEYTSRPEAQPEAS